MRTIDQELLRVRATTLRAALVASSNPSARWCLNVLHPLLLAAEKKQLSVPSVEEQCGRTMHDELYGTEIEAAYSQFKMALSGYSDQELQELMAKALGKQA